jgi:hypothetical protein
MKRFCCTSASVGDPDGKVGVLRRPANVLTPYYELCCTRCISGQGFRRNTRFASFRRPTRCALTYNPDRVWTATMPDGCNTIAQFFQYPLRIFRGIPSKLPFNLRWIDRIGPIMPGPIGYKRKSDGVLHRSSGGSTRSRMSHIIITTSMFVYSLRPPTLYVSPTMPAHSTVKALEHDPQRRPNHER